MTSIGRRHESRKMYSKFQTSQDLRGEILTRTLDILRPRYGTLSNTLEGKLDSIATQMVERFKETGHPVFKSISALRSWNSEKKRWQRYHTLQCGFIEYRTLVPHNSLSKSAQYLRRQSRAGVKSSLNGLRIKKSQLRRSSWQKKMSSY